MVNLNEGMREGDLEDLVIPLISVDEYESKIDPDAIVIGFYVNDKDAADDLNRFIQKSAVQILDSEVSPAPDQHGYYMVFVELMNDTRIANNMAAILDEVSPLCKNSEWRMRIRDVSSVKLFSRKFINAHMAKLRNNLEDDGASEDHIMEFFRFSDLDNVIVSDRTLAISGQNATLTGEIIDFRTLEALNESSEIKGKPVSMTLLDTAEALQLNVMLGSDWSSSRHGDTMVLQSRLSDKVLLLRNAKIS